MFYRYLTLPMTARAVLPEKIARKSSPDLTVLFESVAPSDPKVERRKMFGWPACFVNGNMFMALHEESLILRLSEEDRQAFLKLEGAAQFKPLPGKAMKEYVVAPAWMLEEKAALRKWVNKSLHYSLGLPKKVTQQAAQKKVVPRRAARGHSS